MREGQFIKQSIDRWQRYEIPTDDPDELAKQFTNLVDDVAYAKTFYPFGNTVKYLNGLGTNIYLSIYKNRREKNNRIITFWTEEVPLIMHRHRKILLFAFLFFAVSLLLGAFSSKYDQTFIRAMLGDAYVDQTEHNIANNDAFNIYKQDSEFHMFLYIAQNNIGVAFNCFIMGILCSVGSIFLLMREGLRLGAFEQFFFHASASVGWKSILTVFIHGTLEISAIVISGCAGIVLGNAILFPKTFTRLQSIRQGAKDGVKIMVSLVPVFIVAAFFEGYVTRHTEMPIFINILILGASLAFILFYYVFYPQKVSKRIPQPEDALPL